MGPSSSTNFAYGIFADVLNLVTITVLLCVIAVNVAERLKKDRDEEDMARRRMQRRVMAHREAIEELRRGF